MVPAYSVEPTGFEYAQQPYLHLGGHFGDFIKEQCPATSPLEVPAMGARSTGKCAFFVAEQLSFDQVGRNGAN